MNKWDLFVETERLVKRFRPPEQDGCGSCVWFTAFGLLVLRRNGIKACVQAGSMAWRVIDPEHDDGNPTTCTHWSYVWSPNQLPSKIGIALGGMPEVHSWIGLVEEQELVDFSTHDFKNQASRMGFSWRTADPPKFIWSSVRSLPDSAIYEPSRDATIYVGEKIKNMLTDLKLI